MNYATRYADEWTSTDANTHKSVTPNVVYDSGKVSLPHKSLTWSFVFITNREILSSAFKESISLGFSIMSLCFERVTPTRLLPLSYSLHTDAKRMILYCGLQCTGAPVTLVKTQNGLHFSNSGVRQAHPPSSPPGGLPLMSISNLLRRASKKTRTLTLYERIFYNPRRYSEIPQKVMDDMKAQTMAFEYACTCLHLVPYVVQDHHVRCPNISLWTKDNKISQTYLNPKYRQKCNCAYKPSIALFVPPFSFEVVTNGQKKKDGRTPVLSFNSKGPGVDFVVYGHRSSDAADTADTADASFEDLSSCREEFLSDSPLQNSNSNRKNSLSRRRSLSVDDMRTETKPVRKIRYNCPYVRQIPRGVWTKSQNCGAHQMEELHLVVLFGGKDMLAVDWLDLVHVWTQKYLKMNILKIYNEKTTRHQSKEPTSKQCSPHHSPVMAQRVPKALDIFDSARLIPRRNPHMLTNRRNGARLHKDSSSPIPCWDISSELKEPQDVPFTSQPNEVFQTENNENTEKQTTWSSSFMSPRVETRCTYGFAMVDYPGYGGCFGQPSPTSCVDSGIEVIRHCIAELQPTRVKLHIMGYSLGCAIALRVAILLIEFLTQYGYVHEPLSRIHSIQSLVLVSPFTTSHKCVDNYLRVPVKLHNISTLVWHQCASHMWNYDNEQAIVHLGDLLRRNAALFNNFKFSVIVGGKDRVTPEFMGIFLTKKLLETLGSSYVEKFKIEIHCIRVKNADHSTILTSRRLLKILIKYHNVFDFQNIPSNR